MLMDELLLKVNFATASLKIKYEYAFLEISCIIITTASFLATVANFLCKHLMKCDKIYDKSYFYYFYYRNYTSKFVKKKNVIYIYLFL